MFYNPAGLTAATRPMVMMMHSESVQDVRMEVLGASIPAGRWALGISLQANTVADVPIRSSAASKRTVGRAFNPLVRNRG